MLRLISIHYKYKHSHYHLFLYYCLVVGSTESMWDILGHCLGSKYVYMCCKKVSLLTHMSGHELELTGKGHDRYNSKEWKNLSRFVQLIAVNHSISLENPSLLTSFGAFRTRKLCLRWFWSQVWRTIFYFQLDSFQSSKYSIRKCFESIQRHCKMCQWLCYLRLWMTYPLKQVHSNEIQSVTWRKRRIC